MNIAQLRTLRSRQSHPFKTHIRPLLLTRRTFLQATGGAVAGGAVLGSGLWPTQVAQAKGGRGGDDPLPIPGGSPLLGGGFHVYGPGFPDFDAADSEPSSITNFNGAVGLAYISGTVTRKNRMTGETDELPFLFSDMRFMDGIYAGDDGRVRQGTFGFI